MTTGTFGREQVLPEIMGKVVDREWWVGGTSWTVHTYSHTLESTDIVFPAAVCCAFEIFVRKTRRIRNVRRATARPKTCEG
jgi:hypothetical protein